MKIFLIVLVMLASYLIGQNIKEKVQNEYNFLVYLNKFTIYLKSNLCMFKTDIVQIIDEFILLQANDCENFNKIFYKENEVYCISKKEIEKNNSVKEDSFVIFSFLNSLGSNSYEFEENKINSFLFFLETKQKLYFDCIKTKGVLSQRVFVSIGLIISILIW